MKYLVTATMYTKLVCEVEADSLDEAWAIAKETDGGSFTALPDGDWDISDVQEVTL